MEKNRIDIETVQHVARLARLDMKHDELEKHRESLDAILGYVDKLNELDTSDVTPMAHVSADATLMRDDVFKPGLGERSLNNAPDRDARFFRVPQVIE